MRTINYLAWGATLAMAVSMAPAMAQSGDNPEVQTRSGPSSDEMSRLQEKKWVIQQRIELAELQKTLAELRGPEEPKGQVSEDREESDGDREQKQSVSADPSPDETWVMTQYSRYGDDASAQISSVYGQLTVEAGDPVGEWQVTAIGPKGVSVENEKLGNRRIPFSDQYSYRGRSNAASGNSGFMPPGMN